MTNQKSFHDPCPYGNDDCPKCTNSKTTMTNPTTLEEDVREVAVFGTKYIRSATPMGVSEREKLQNEIIQRINKLLAQKDTECERLVEEAREEEKTRLVDAFFSIPQTTYKDPFQKKAFTDGWLSAFKIMRSFIKKSLTKPKRFDIVESEKYPGCYNIYDLNGNRVRYFAEYDNKNLKRAEDWVKNNAKN